MTKKEAKMVKPGDVIVNRDGLEFIVLSVCPGWKGFLSSKELELVRDKPDFYDFVVRRTPFLSYGYKEVQLKK